MDSDSTPQTAESFLRRIAGLPLVNEALLKALASYESARQYSPALDSTLGAIENGVKFAAEKTAPSTEGMLKSSVDFADKVACKGLDRLEETVPAVRMTPEQLQEVTSEYYENSSVKKGVDFGKGKLHEYAAAPAALVDYGVAVLGASLDYCDGMIDNYVAEEEATTAAADGNTSYKERVQVMGSKLATGLSTKTQRQAGNAKLVVQKAISELRDSLVLLDFYRNWAKEKTANLMIGAATLKDKLELQAKHYKIEPDVLLLRWVKLSSAVLYSASEQMVKRTERFLPDKAKESLQKATDYMHHLNDSFAEAQSLTDVKDEVLGEAKEKLTAVEQGLVGVWDQLSEYSPWKHTKEEEKTE